jgi:hypothetical protein
MKKVLASLAVALAVTVLAGLPLAAQTGTWTAVASTGVVDESAAGIYAFGATNLGYNAAGSVAPIVARYNVTNTFGGGSSDTPPWMFLELGYFDNAAASQVSATLFRVNPCTGAQVALCTVTSFDSAASTCNTCAFAGGSINFAAALYYVEVRISRTAVAVSPQALTLRIR